MKKRVIIVGAGGHGKVIADIIEKAEDKVVGFLDDNETGKIFGYDVIGKIADIKKFQYKNNFVIAIGDNYLRKQIAEQNDVEWYTAIHPSVQVAKGVKIGSGTVIMAGSIINSGAKIGRHVIVNTGTIVEHDNRIGDYVHLSPRVVLGGTVTIGCCSHIGIGACVKNNIVIGNDIVIGAGATVVENLVCSGIYVGVPARLVMSHTMNITKMGGVSTHKTNCVIKLLPYVAREAA